MTVASRVGHYERFLDENLSQAANVTTGQVYSHVIAKERRGEYLGDTVQVIPHITDEIKRRMRLPVEGENALDIIITEIGGTVGDIESLPFLEKTLHSQNLDAYILDYLGIEANPVDFTQRDNEHPYYIATQAHPEYRSRPTRPHPLFAGLIKAALEARKNG